MKIEIKNEDAPFYVINIKETTTIVKDNESYDLSHKSGYDKFRHILSLLLSNSANYTYKRVEESNHLDYLSHYLYYYDSSAGFKTETVVLEMKYMSLSYLKDYSRYYSNGYSNFGKYCRRLHFFQHSFTTEDFDTYITKPDSNLEAKFNLKNYYLGHIVTKPLPNALIGATLLRCYDEYYNSLRSKGLHDDTSYLERNRKFHAIRRYDINLFGKKITINTLVFQEQDQAVSACATVALWMCFHKISYLFDTSLPAPIDITESAGLNDRDGRSVPSTGLNLKQIITAIDNLNKDLVCEVYTFSDIHKIAVKRSIIHTKIIEPWKIKRYMYAYLRLEIPVLLGYRMMTNDANHLVTITGYRFEKPEERKEQNILSWFPKEEESNIKCQADRISRIYSHDDQLGPFSKIGFNHDGYSKYLFVNWRSKDNFNLASGKLVIIPILNFIRIKYTHIEIFAEKFQEFLTVALSGEALLNNFIWDIYITKSNSYKEELVNSHLQEKIKRKAVTVSFPRYIWNASLRVVTDPSTMESTKIIDFIFDATSTPKGMNLFKVFYFSETVRKQFKDIVDKYGDDFEEKVSNTFFQGSQFLNQMTTSI